MSLIALRTLTWGDREILPGERVPENEPGREYELLKVWRHIKEVTEEEEAQMAEEDDTVTSVDQTHQPEVDETDEPGAGDVDIPDDWEDMTWNEKRSLAGKLSMESITNKETAERVIRDHQNRRG